MLNTIALTGRLVETPELRKTQKDVSVTSFRIAVARDFSTKGEDDTDFFDIVAWRSTADFVAKYFEKGKMITVVGRLKNRKWQDKEGNNRSSAEIQAENVYFGESKPSDSGQFDRIDPFADGNSAPAEISKSPWD